MLHVTLQVSHATCDITGKSRYMVSQTTCDITGKSRYMVSHTTSDITGKSIYRHVTPHVTLQVSHSTCHIIGNTHLVHDITGNTHSPDPPPLSLPSQR